MMLGPLSSKVNNFFHFQRGQGKLNPPPLHADPDSGQCTMKTNTRFVLKPESGQQYIFDYFRNKQVRKQ